MKPSNQAQPDKTKGQWIYRHAGLVRLTHWINLICLIVLLMSGLQIFNAHPALYWGQASDFQAPWISLWDSNGFPGWATLPGERWLAMGRRWHFFFAWAFVANGIAYMAYGFASGHFKRDLLPTKRQLQGIGLTVLEHLRLRFPKGEEARRYNVLQKLAYLIVIFVFLPGIVLAGWAMSPFLDSVAPILDLFGGRQSARTMHFVFAFGLVGFVIIHVLMVLVSGVWNNLRSMITGRYLIEEEGGRDEPGAE